MKSVPLYTQHDAMDCGPTCLWMVTAFYGRHFSLQYLRENCFLSRQGVSMLGISEAAETNHGNAIYSDYTSIDIDRLLEILEIKCNQPYLPEKCELDKIMYEFVIKAYYEYCQLR